MNKRRWYKGGLDLEGEREEARVADVEERMECLEYGDNMRD